MCKIVDQILTKSKGMCVTKVMPKFDIKKCVQLKSEGTCVTKLKWKKQRHFKFNLTLIDYFMVLSTLLLHGTHSRRYKHGAKNSS
jgi:hypothetical protein